MWKGSSQGAMRAPKTTDAVLILHEGRGTDTENTRNALWDTVKALGIISIVLGHICPYPEVIKFVYSYHLIIFFFVAGVLFNTEKYGDRPIAYAVGRIRRMWPPYFLYYLFFILIHNFVSDTEYGIKDTLLQIFKASLFRGKESLGGALWFIPFMLIVLFAFEASAFLSRRLFKKNASVAVAVIAAAVGGAGLLLNHREISLPFHLQACLLMLPAVAAGYLFTELKLSPDKIFKWWAAIPAAAVVVISSNIQNRRIELAADQTGGAERFYLVSLCGVYMICTAAHCISKLPHISRLLSTTGRYTFDIMSLHMLINYLTVKAFAYLPEEVGFLAWIVSLLLGMTVPIAVRRLAARVYSLIKRVVKRSDSAESIM